MTYRITSPKEVRRTLSWKKAKKRYELMKKKHPGKDVAIWSNGQKALWTQTKVS